MVGVVPPAVSPLAPELLLLAPELLLVVPREPLLDEPPLLLLDGSPVPELVPLDDSLPEEPVPLELSLPELPPPLLDEEFFPDELPPLELLVFSKPLPVPSEFAEQPTPTDGMRSAKKSEDVRRSWRTGTSCWPWGRVRWTLRAPPDPRQDRVPSGQANNP
jgi:hypothetical protein